MLPTPSTYTRWWFTSKKVYGKGHEGPKREQTYCYTLSLTSALYGVGGQSHVSATLSPQKRPCTHYKRLGGSHSWSGQVQKISHPLGFELWTVQPPEIHYRPAVYAILAADSVVKHKFSVRCLYLSIPGKFIQILPPDRHQLLLLCYILLLFNVQWGRSLSRATEDKLQTVIYSGILL